jgi:Ca2+-transporting ATPase
MHIVLLELVIDPVCSLVFEAEPSESRSMQEPPRRKDEPLFGPPHIAFALFQGLVVFLTVCVFYGWALTVATEEQARGAAFASLVFANLVMALSDAAGGRAGLFDRHHAIFWIIATAAGVVLLTAFAVPAIAGILQIAPPPADLLLIGLAAAGVSAGWFGIAKAKLFAGALKRTQRAV